MEHTPDKTTPDDSPDLREPLHPVKQQVLENTLWLVKLRWVAVGAMVAGGSLASLAGYNIPLPAILALALYLLIANFVFTLLSPYLAAPEVSGERIRLFSNAQIIADWIAIIILVYLTGSITSPFIFFFFFHLVLAAIMQPVMNIYFNATIAVVLMVTVFLLEFTGVIPHQTLFEGSVGYMIWQPRFLAAFLVALCLSIFFTVYFATWVSEHWRQRVGELYETQKRLEDATHRMQAIYEVLRLVGVNFELDQLLAKVAQEATRLWGINAAFIALYDTKSGKYELAAVHGLEERSRPDIQQLFGDPAFCEQLGKGAPFSLQGLTDGPEPSPLSAPALLWQRSLMIVPLRVGQTQIGGFGLLSQNPSRFSDDDSQYFQVFCDLAAIEIESARISQTLRAHNLARSWFYHQVAHEMRAPLAAVRSMLDLVVQGYVSDPAKLKDLVERAGGRLRGLTESINDLLLLAQDRTESIKPSLEEVDLAATLTSLLELFEGEARKKDIRLDVSIEDDIPKLTATSEGLERICSNLISNAIKYTLRGGQVRVSLSKPDLRSVCLVVSDTGIGIPSESQGNLFKEFYRAPNAKKLAEIGTGLGLTITRKLVEDFSGKIQYESQEGRGTSFTVLLPIVAPQATPGA